MEVYVAVCVMLSLIAGQSSAAILSVRAEVSQDIVALSRNVSFVCTIEKSSEQDEVAVEIGKYLHDYKAGEIQEQLINKAGGAFLSDRYNAHSERYQITRETSNLEEIYTVTINPVDREDDAPFGCREVSQEEWSQASFQTRATPTTSEWGGYSNGATVHIEEEVGASINCTIGGGSPAPDVFIRVGDYDYTDQFQRTVLTEVECGPEEWVRDEECLMHRNVLVTMHADEFEPLPEHHMRDLECVGQVPGLDMESQIATVTIDYLFKPAFFCPDQIEADLGKRDVSLPCDYDANPTVDDIYWSFEYQGEDYKLRNGETTEDGGIRASISDLETSLTIDRVTEEHYKTYTIVAVSSRGTTEYNMHLTEVGAPHPGSASTASLSLLAVLTAAVFGMRLLW